MKFTFESGTRPLAGYTIKRAIHRGGFGEVYYAVSDEGREVALKLLQHNSDVELRGVRQCFNLSHPNLVTIFDIRQDDESDYWVVMEYVDGDTLDQAIRQAPNGMSIGDASKWLEGITRGVEYMHSRGLVHRDLKPANVFRSGSTIKVGDIGLSKFVTPSRRSAHTQSVGTVYYMAPEVAKGQYGREVDVYAMGIILYEMLTGTVPFDGESTAEILMKHLTEKPDLSLLPPSVREVVGRALQKDPSARFSSMNEMWTAYSDAISGRTARATAAPKVSPLAPVNGHHGPSVKPAVQTVAATAAAGGKDSAATGAVAMSGAWLMGMLRNPWSWPVLALAAFFAVPLALGIAWSVLGFLVFCLLVAAVWKIGSAFMQGWRHDADTQSSPSAPVIPPPPSDARAERVGDQRVAQHVPHSTVRRAGLVRDISWSTRIMHFTGSAAVAVFCAIVLTAGLVLFLPGLFLNADGNATDYGLIGLFAFTSIVATWTLMFVTKLLEGRRVDDASRRMLQAAAGCFVGIAVWVCGEFLMTGAPNLDMVDNAQGHGYQFAPTHDVPSMNWGGRPLFGAHGEPLLHFSVLFFAALFGLRRWWRQTDELRPQRFRLASVLFTMGLAFLICQIIPFPEIWGVVLAAVISSVVQVASVWQSNERPQRRVPHGQHAHVVA